MICGDKTCNSCVASLLSDSEKNGLVAAFSALHDTYSRPITAWHEGEVLVVSTTPNASANVNFNRLNRFDQTSLNPDRVPVSATFNARIYYDKKEDNPLAQLMRFNATSQEKVRMPNGMVRIKVDASGNSFMLGSKRIKLDGNLFDVDSVERPHGIFGSGYWDWWLKRLV